MTTKKTLNEIEVALAKSKEFDYTKNIVAFNVKGISELLPIHHECDMLVLTKSGYLTEIEIKRSWADFIADFKKKHNHHNYPLIKYFYYCVPSSLLGKVMDRLEKEVEQTSTTTHFNYTGIITYDEELNVMLHGRRIGFNGKQMYPQMTGSKKLFLEQRLELCRLASMRVITLKEKLNNLNEKK